MIERKTFAIYVITKHGLGIAENIRRRFPGSDLFVSSRLFDQAPAGSIKMGLPMGPTLEKTWLGYYCHIHIISVGAVFRMTKDLVKDKKVDPAIVCIDDAANFAICLLSGHVGRGNLYTSEIAEATGATPVITTASDSIGTLTVDILGRELDWTLDDLDRNITQACAEVVNGNKVAFIQETGEANFWPLDSRLPKGVQYFTSMNDVIPADFEMLLICSDREFREEYPEHWQKSVIYRPKSLILGLGCDRDTPPDVVEQGVLKFLSEEGLSSKSVKGVASIDKKADEPALVALAKKYNWPFEVYPAEELDVVKGIENPSETVKKYVGTRSVAEAASLLRANTSFLLMPKKSFNMQKGGKNMTCAIARIPFAKRGGS